MKILVTHSTFDSAEGEMTIRVRRLPDHVIFTDCKPNPDDFPQDLIVGIEKWTQGEQV